MFDWSPKIKILSCYVFSQRFCSLEDIHLWLAPDSTLMGWLVHLHDLWKGKQESLQSVDACRKPLLTTTTPNLSGTLSLFLCFFDQEDSARWYDDWRMLPKCFFFPDKMESVKNLVFLLHYKIPKFDLFFVCLYFFFAANRPRTQSPYTSIFVTF